MKKLTNNNLVALLVTAAITSNVVAGKVLEFSILNSRIVLPGSAFSYVFTFFISSLITELFGKEEAVKAVKTSLICQFISFVIIAVTEQLPSSSEEMQTAYSMILGSTWALVTANFVAVASSQILNVNLFSKIKEKAKSKGLSRSLNCVWSFISILISQIVDTVLFYGIAFGVGYKYLWTQSLREDLLLMMLGQYVIKVILSLVSIPLFYFLTKKKSKSLYEV